MKPLRRLLAAAFLLFFLAHGQAQNFLTNGLVAYYPFNGNASDASGNGNNGIVDGAVPGTNRFGVMGSYLFVGSSSNDIIVFPTLASNNLAELTLSAWINAFAAPTNPFVGDIISKWRCYGYTIADYDLSIQPDMRVAFANGRNGSGYFDLPNHCDIFSANPLSLGRWYHVVATLDSAGTGKLWVNGVLSANDYILPLLPPVTEPVRIGQALYATNSPFNGFIEPSFNGLIDDVRIYDRALSSNEVQQLYQYELTPPPSFLTNGLVAYYPFNGNATDASGNGNNGRVQGATLTTDRFGVLNSAYRFNGIDNLIAVPETLFGPTTHGATVSAWVTTDNGPYTGDMQIYSKGGMDGALALAIHAGQVIFGPKLAGSQTYFLASSPLFSNSVIHLVGIYQQGQSSSLYVNGVLANTISIPNDTLFVDSLPYASAIGILDFTPSPYQAFRGIIDDVRIYNRALSAFEVQQLHAYESPPLTNCFPHPATATAEVVNGFVVGATITDGGCGYTNTPLVLFEGGGGTGATAVAVVSNGVVANIIITDAGIGYTSTPMILIGSAPSIAVQPQSVTVNIHDTAFFNVVPGAFTPVSYQWSLNGTNIAGATTASLTIANVTESALGSYSVLLTNGFGWTNSSPAILSMYPYLAVQFRGALAYWGQDTTLSVQAGGSEPLTYQWYQNGVPVPNGTNAQLILSGIQFTNAGLYSVVVNNPFGSVTNAPAQVVVNPAGVSLGLYPGVTISGTVGYNYVIQRTPDLTNTNSWVTLTNLTLSQPVQIWVDTSTDTSKPGNPHFFYRVLPGQ